MNEVIEAFESQKYVYLPDFLDTSNCEELVAELRKLVAKGATHKDEQCPLSEAVHGAAVFDSLLEQLVPSFEQACGKKLHPTYAYARLYAPGDELKIHTDRPSCEISATLTLGFDGEQWPIFMADYGDDGREVITQQGETKRVINESKILMNVGDAVLYRGMDKVHWREKFEGKWQAQVFLHYVDADGPHAEWKYDKRKKLSHHETGSKDLTYFAFVDAFSPEACKKAIEVAEQIEGQDAEIGAGANGVVNKEIRDVKRIPMPVVKGIGAAMTGIALNANREKWQFDISHSNQCDYLKYDVDGHYLAHVDTFMAKDAGDCRKLTVLAFLNDEFEGGKLYIQNGDQKTYPPQKAGTVVIFPSFMLHGVEPVTKGIRRSIVVWMVGPFFK